MNTKNSKNKKTNLKKPLLGKPKITFNIYWIYIAIFIFIGILFFTDNGDSKISREIGWDKLQQVLLKKDYSKITVVNKEFAEIYINTESLNSDTLYNDLKPKSGLFGTQSSPKNAFYVYKFGDFLYFRDQLKDVENQWIAQDTIGAISEVEKNKIISSHRIILTTETRKNFWGDSFSFILPFLILIVIWIVFFRMMRGGNSGSGGMGGGIFNVGKSKARLYDKDNDVKFTFADVAGLEGAKLEVMEIVDFLKNPKKYTDLGGKIPKGALLVGLPGTGKTLLAKAVAGEAKVPFFSISGSDFVEMFVGVGASRVRDLFKTAKEKAPCIIFIDEIDAIGRARGKNLASGSNDERENTLNQLLTEMDGFGTNAGVIIIAATNRADVLDKALLRAGRFDRQIYVDLPDLEERKAIFKVHTKNLKYDKKDVDINFLAKQTPGFSGADIANVCNESALIAARHNKKLITKQDFLDAVDRIVGGLEKKNKVIAPNEKKTIAYHEAGHASVSWMLEHAHPLVKVTIVPRGQALGAAWYLPEERQITTKTQMLHQMISLLGGRASEEIVFGEVSTGALNDLERTTKMAYSMVAYYGLNDKIGNISYYDSTGQSEYGFTKPFSEKTAESIDVEIHKMIEQAYSKAKEILLANRDKLDKLALLLVEKEVIFREDLEEIFGKRPFDEKKDENSENTIESSDQENNLNNENLEINN
ncbi:MAG: ATP-dependent zinc metalloprotease FtsH [Bacteroidales bacterium]|nr:ATP-dependent zinc metalloprotease FtsH [Bacteroidales bacterium]MDD4528453.1 ATP-dependent zinc metalloprotease FtsH [Bacteroidales bacterium]